MGDSDEALVANGDDLATSCYERGLTDTSNLLDVGCAQARLPIGLLHSTDFEGTYVGFDVMPKQTNWAKSALTDVQPGFDFKLVDVHNARYNPKGTVAPEDFRFPVPGSRFDFATLFSIFTHFYLEDVAKYLSELHRTVRGNGLVFVTWFWFDEANEEHVRTEAHYPMTFSHDADTIYNDADDPLRAIAHRESRVRAMIDAAGFDIVDVAHGRWKGTPGATNFQDFILLRRRPDTLRQRLTVRRVIASAKRRVAKLIG